MIKPTFWDARSPDIVMLGADAVTLSRHQPHAQAVAFRNGRIVAVGTDAELENLIGCSTRVINCHGKCLLPGFHDAHIHLLASAGKLLSVDCGPQSVSSITDIHRALHIYAQTVPRGTWIRAGDYDEFSLAERRHLTRWDLDSAAPDHPVKLRHRSQHACVLNSRALQLAGIDSSFSPPAGGRVEVDPVTGQPTGLVYEMEYHLSRRIIPPLDEAALRAALRRVFDALFAVGITAVQDATAHNGPGEWRLFQKTFSQDGPQPRITLMVGPQHFANIGAWGSDDDFGGRLRVGPVKIVLTEAAGEFHPSASELFDMVWEMHRHGLPMAIHAVEESTVCLAVEAIAAAVARLPRRDVQHRLEHASVLPPALLERMAQVGVAVATQPGFLYHHGDRYLAEVDDHLRGWLYALRSMLQRGIAVAAGSDAPVAPANPLQGIYAAITRRTRGGQVVGDGEQISAYLALVLHTLAPARLAGLEARLGSIAPGRRADLVLLSANPLAVHPEEIPRITVDLTMVDGTVVWERASGAPRAED